MAVKTIILVGRIVSTSAKMWWKNTMAVLQKTFIRSLQLTNYKYMRMSPKQNYSPPNLNKIQQKLFVVKSLRSKWLPVSSANLTVPLKQRRMVNSLEKFAEQTREGASLCIMTKWVFSNQRFFDRSKGRINGSTAAQPWLDTEWLHFISVLQE